MLKRRIYENLLDWKLKKDKKALLITGARQIGKTYIIREFGKQNYKNFVEINFVTQPSAIGIFRGDLNAEELITNITAFTCQILEPGNTLLFFDEIQECPEARTAIKFLVDDGRFDYIESGSFLGVTYKEVKSYPVGYEEVITMYPMDLQEFLTANGVQEESVCYLKSCYEEEKEVSPSVHDTILKLFQYYAIVGGMPAAVQSFVEYHDVAKVLQIQRDIVELYRQDIAKYSKNDKARIKDIFDTIPSELNKKNKRFFLSDIDKNARNNRYESSFAWLSDAGVSLPCYNVTAPVLPFKLNEQRNLQKLYLNDCGLLCGLSLGNIQYDILQGDLSVNMGSVLENVFAESLKSNGFELYYFDKKNIGELDFMVQKGKHIELIEVKSGKDYEKHPALNHVLNQPEWKIERACVFCQGNVKREDKIIYLPWYMVMFFQQEKLPESLVVEVDLSGL